jgi:hypothetical protein
MAKAVPRKAENLPQILGAVPERNSVSVSWSMGSFRAPLNMPGRRNVAFDQIENLPAFLRVWDFHECFEQSQHFNVFTNRHAFSLDLVGSRPLLLGSTLNCLLQSEKHAS